MRGRHLRMSHSLRAETCAALGSLRFDKSVSLNLIGDQIPKGSAPRQSRFLFPAQPNRRIDSPRFQSRTKPGEQGRYEH
jgi:hypothetical protein